MQNAESNIHRKSELFGRVMTDQQIRKHYIMDQKILKISLHLLMFSEENVVS